jgi:hypothetical protein
MLPPRPRSTPSIARTRRPPHEAIAPSLERWSEETFSAVVLGVPAVIDLDGAVRLGSERGVRIAHAEADGLVTTLRDALRASARAADRPSSDRHLGTLSLSNVLLSATGRFWLVGLGHNVIVHDAHGRLAPRGRFFQAPEIALGRRPPSSPDFVSLLVLLRGMAAFVDVHRAIVEVAAGSSLRQDLELLERVLWIERRVIHAPPSARASIDEAIAVGDRIRALIGVQPDVRAFVHRMGDLLGGTVALEAPRERAVLRVDMQGRWIERGRGPRVDLSRRDRARPHGGRAGACAPRAPRPRPRARRARGGLLARRADREVRRSQPRVRRDQRPAPRGARGRSREVRGRATGSPRSSPASSSTYKPLNKGRFSRALPCSGP